MMQSQLYLFVVLATAVSFAYCDTDICDLCSCDFLDEKHISPYSIVCNCRNKNSQVHFRTKAPRMRNVTGVIINNCDHVIFHDNAFATTGAFNLHIMSVNVLELKANSMLGANLQKVSISNVNALALEQGSVRQGYFDDIVLDSVNIPNLPNVGSGEAIRIRKSMTLKNVTIGIMMASAVKSTFLGDNTTLFMENVTVEKIAPSAVNLVADFIDVKGCTFGPSTQGFILEGKQRVSMSMNSMTRENQNDFMNIKAPFINMSDNIISLPLVFLGETVKPAGKFAKLIFNSNKIRDTTFMVV